MEIYKIINMETLKNNDMVNNGESMMKLKKNA